MTFMCNLGEGKFTEVVGNKIIQIFPAKKNISFPMQTGNLLELLQTSQEHAFAPLFFWATAN